MSMSKYVRGPYLPREVRRAIDHIETALQAHQPGIKIIISEKDLKIIYQALNRYKQATQIDADKLLALLIYSNVCRFLFSVQDEQRKIVRALNASTISPALRDTFSYHGIPLSNQASVQVVTPGAEWRITYQGRVFIIQLEDGTLNIYARRNYPSRSVKLKDIEEFLDKSSEEEIKNGIVKSYQETRLRSTTVFLTEVLSNYLEYNISSILSEYSRATNNTEELAD